MLPIESVLEELREALSAHPRVVLEAPPGAGKTTRVPIALMNERWVGDGRIVMLEPRRLATRAAARRMASTLGERVGATVGYRMRLDSRVSDATRIEVVTEGTLTRLIQADPELSGVSALIFDEFHERNLASDLGLALALDVQSSLRPELRILVMSATLDSGRVAELLGDAPVVQSHGRAFPVETRYLDHTSDEDLATVCARAVRDALHTTEGDMLVFLPGVAEIRRTAEQLGELPHNADLHSLFGAASAGEQDAAIAPAIENRRKVVLSTDIAESSLTIEGVRVVVDAGLARRPRFDPGRGMERLETIRIARDSADQRRGRAGRTRPGVCIRLWTRFEDDHLAPHSIPEIQQADLAPLALELAAWGVADAAQLAWLDPPPREALMESRQLLRLLGALDDDLRVTAHGRELLTTGLHPRLGHMAVTAMRENLGGAAAELAAILQERDFFRQSGRLPAPSDIGLRIDALGGRKPYAVNFTVDQARLRRVRQEAARIRDRLRADPPVSGASAAGYLLALAYPDRIAQRVSPGRFRMRSGHPVVLESGDALADEPFIVVAHAGGRGLVMRAFLAAPISEDDLRTAVGADVETSQLLQFDPATGIVQAEEVEKVGAIVLRRRPLSDPSPASVAAALLEGVHRLGLACLPWDDQPLRLRQRLAFLHLQFPERYPDVSDEALLSSAESWLLPHLTGMRRIDDLRRLDMGRLLLDRLDWRARNDLDELAPDRLAVPSGSSIQIDYSDPLAPALPVRLQEVFGMMHTPRIGGGTVPVTMHLLSPAHRPVQITQDLANFWRSSYFDVRRDMRGRYPKHHWPEDPLTAEPTRRTKRR